MTSSDSRSEYAGRMHRVLAHIDQQLDQTLDLETLAGVAHFSPFHFHRLFSAWMGETLGDYLRRRRVEVAAMRLAAQPRVPVFNIALSVGFGSAEAFARAFKIRFGCSPSAWRARTAIERAAKSNPDQMERKTDQMPLNILQKNEASRNARPEANMNVRLIDRQPVTIAYLRHIGPYGAPISRFWQEVVYPWMVTSNLMGHARYGISHDDPGVTAPAQCRYDAGVEVADDYMPFGNALKTSLPGGRYAALYFKGTLPDVGEAWNALLRDWLPSSGLQLDARPAFEYYPVDAKYDPQTGMFECQICIPVAPL